MSGPFLECLPLLAGVSRSVVDASHSSPMAGDVVQYGLDDVWLDTNVSHGRRMPITGFN
jgi:hypothetical protein